VGCNKNQGFCDGKGNCVANSRFWYYYFHKRTRGVTLKKKYMKKHLKNKKKFKNFNLAEIDEEEIFESNLTIAIQEYDSDMSDGYLEELEKIIQLERKNRDLDYDPLDEFDS